MSRAEEWEKELIHRFPSIDRDGVPATAEFIAILEEMGGFDEGAYLHYHYVLSGDIIITFPESGCGIAPIYTIDNLVSSFRCMFSTSSYPHFNTRYIVPTPKAIRDFLSTNWSELFPQDTEGKGE